MMKTPDQPLPSGISQIGKSEDRGFVVGRDYDIGDRMYVAVTPELLALLDDVVSLIDEWRYGYDPAFTAQHVQDQAYRLLTAIENAK